MRVHISIVVARGPKASQYTRLMNAVATLIFCAIAGAPNGSGFLGTGHGGEYVFSVAVHSTAGDSRDLLTPGQHVHWPEGTGLTVVKESQIGPFLSTEEVCSGR